VTRIADVFLFGLESEASVMRQVPREIQLLVQNMLDAELFLVGPKAWQSECPTLFQRAVLEEVERRNIDLSQLDV
jgi:hypothetical protein